MIQVAGRLVRRRLAGKLSRSLLRLGIYFSSPAGSEPRGFPRARKDSPGPRATYLLLGMGAARAVYYYHAYMVTACYTTATPCMMHRKLVLEHYCQVPMGR